MSNGSFCPDPLWNWNVTWNTKDPELTACFRDTVLPLIPLSILLLSVISHVLQCQSNSLLARRDWLKSILCLVFSLTLIVFAMVSFLRETTRTPSRILRLSVEALFLVGILLLEVVQLVTKRKLPPSRGFIWTVVLLCRLPDCKACLENERLIFWCLPEPLILLFLAILNAFKHDDLEIAHERVGSSPEETSSWASWIIFAWLDKFLWRGYKQQLWYDDLPNLPSFIDPALNFHQFWVRWTKDVQSGRKPRLWIVLIKTFRSRLLLCLFFTLIRVLLNFAHPLLLRVIMRHIKNDDEETWKGYFYVVVLLFSSVIFVLTFSHYVQQATIVGMQFKNAIICALNRKTLKLSSSARMRYPATTVVNYVSVDCDLILKALPFSPHIVHDPLIVAIGMGLLYWELGPSSLIGVGITALCVSLTMLGNKRLERNQEEILRAKDERVGTTSDTLKSILMVKMQAWENVFFNRIQQFRNEETNLLRRNAFLFSSTLISFNVVPVLVTVAVFAVFITIDPVNNVLTAETMFVSLALFNIIREQLDIFPNVILGTQRMWISLRRIQEFLLAEEVEEMDTFEEENAKDDNGDQNAVRFESAKFSWTGERSHLLSIEDLKIENSSFAAIVGRVASGKSSFISSIIGSVQKLEGRLLVNGSLAYVPQDPWILNRTIRENICLGNVMDDCRYRQVLRACQLMDDLKVFPAQDLTEIGSYGINLSGGQKARLSLARALYSDRDIFLLDDIFSALDATVSECIFRDVIDSECGLLRGKTRVLVTQNLNFLSKADQIIVLDEGHIVEKGSYAELLQRSEIFSKMLREFKSAKLEIASPKHHLNETLEENSNVRAAEEAVNGQLVTEETVELGSIKWSIYKDYLSYYSIPITLVIIILFALSEGIRALELSWLAVWSDKNTNGNVEPTYYLGIFFGLGILEIMAAYFRVVLLLERASRASKQIHESLLSRILKAPMSFYDQNPLGRLANRFAGDLDTIDVEIPKKAICFLDAAFIIVTLSVVISVVTPLFLIMFSVLFMTFLFILKFYITSARQTKRLESVSRSPILSHFYEVQDGIDSIRSFENEELFESELMDHLKTFTKCHYLNQSTFVWLGTRMDSLSAFIVFSAALFAVISRDSVSQGFAGLSITYAANSLTSLSWMVHVASSLEMASIALERIFQYFHIPIEPISWGHQEEENTDQRFSGLLEFRNYSARYRDDLDLALKEVNIRASPGEKIGIFGRTGSGKSTLTKAIFRIIEPAAGSILIDNDDLQNLPLGRIRSSISIIPQDPVLFSGSLRFNLDPTEQHGDDVIKEALDQLGIAKMFRYLQASVQDGGSNFSRGERQLICLARAILRHNNILILDEATASMDSETDSLIQRSLRTTFADKTVLIVAHRMNTISDCDRIFEVKNGMVVQRK